MVAAVVEVVAAVVERNGRYLITRRLEGTHLAGLWEFPGGKILPGEEPEDITFAAGARALRARYNDIMKQRRTNAEAQVPGRWVPLRPHRP